jgi:5-amino-6-(5-phosphoribosylamino)uracil reductase
MTHPHVTLIVAISIDGKISTTGRESFRLGSDEDEALMSRVRQEVDAVIVSSTSILVDKYAVVNNKEPHPLNILISRSLNFSPQDCKFFQHPDTKKLVFTTARSESVAPYAEVIPTTDPKKVLEELSKRGVEHLLLETGGTLTAEFFERELVDEIYLTVCPLVIGGAKAPTPFDGIGLKKERCQHFHLLSCTHNQHGEIFLHYKKKEILDEYSRS